MNIVTADIFVINLSVFANNLPKSVKLQPPILKCQDGIGNVFSHTFYAR